MVNASKILRIIRPIRKTSSRGAGGFGCVRGLLKRRVSHIRKMRRLSGRLRMRLMVVRQPGIRIAEIVIGRRVVARRIRRRRIPNSGASQLLAVLRYWNSKCKVLLDLCARDALFSVSEGFRQRCCAFIVFLRANV